ncbi:MAG: hypothetical protein Q4A28_02020 [Brachymonas sp.]|nr:hypothetical protein [Brachymonas sp.]
MKTLKLQNLCGFAWQWRPHPLSHQAQPEQTPTDGLNPFFESFAQRRNV